MNFRLWLEASESDKDFDEEQEFAQRIIKKEMALEGFQYYEDYVKTVAKEATMVAGKCLFIGSGPVPLTAILLKKNHGIDVTGLEYNAGAAQLSERLLEALGMQLPIIVGDAIQFKGYGGYQTIMVALEAGPTEQTKRAIFDNIKSQITPRTKLLIRGSNTAAVAGSPDSEAFPGVEGYVRDYFEVVNKVPVFSNLSTSYLLQCQVCPVGGAGVKKPMAVAPAPSSVSQPAMPRLAS